MSSNLPAERPGDDIVIQQSQFRPIDPKDDRSRWEKFRDCVRRILGMKPVCLVERFAEAKVRKEEIDNEVKLLNASRDYQKVMAEMARLERESNADVAEKKARTRATKVRTRIQEWALEQLKATNLAPEDAAAKVEEIIQKIELIYGGKVEIPLPESDAEVLEAIESIAASMPGVLRTGEKVPQTGKYVAIGCCRQELEIRLGKKFPRCKNATCQNFKKSTTWKAPPGPLQNFTLELTP